MNKLIRKMVLHTHLETILFISLNHLKYISGMITGIQDFSCYELCCPASFLRAGHCEESVK